MTSFDLTVIPVHRKAGIDQPLLVGLHAVAPPRRAARGRKTDQLILLLSFEGVPPFPTDRIVELLNRLEKGFYETPGSLTAASRDMIDELNRLMVNINERNTGKRPPVLGSITLLVVREDELYLAQCGPGHLFVLMPRKVEYIHDEKAEGRGLGSSRTASIHFAQMQLAAGNRLLFTPHVPDNWTAETFQEAHGQPLPVAHRCFMQDSDDDTEAVLVDVVPGKGAVNLISASGPLLEAAPPRVPVGQPAKAAQPPAHQETWDPVSAQEETPLGEPDRHEPMAQEAQQSAQSQAQYEESLHEMHRQGPAPHMQAEQRPARKQIAMPNFAPAILDGVRKWRAFSDRIFKGASGFFQRILPWDEMAKIPTSYAAFIAVAVPLIVITVAALVYVQRGKTQQFDYYLAQAQAKAAVAQKAEDPVVQRQAWSSALSNIETAEGYFVTPASTTLRYQASGALDELDKVTRLDFTPAIAGTMASSIKIRHMFATSNEIYMLDTANDEIYRAQLIGDRYEMDHDFRCGNGHYGSLNVEGLIDMAPLPENPDGAALVAVDSGGNLLYCYPDKPPVAVPLVQPDNYFSDDIVGITLEDEQLYILDAGRNMVWFYTPTDSSYQYRDAPYFFFQDEVPDMLNVLDFAVDREELYLLYNGSWETTECAYSKLEEAPTTCVEPQDYTDTRPGKESGPTIPGAVFVQIQHTQPPEPSLYYLDPIARSIYHFSLRLNLVQEYRPQLDFESGPITAFAISSSRHLFIAMDNKVFVSALP